MFNKNQYQADFSFSYSVSKKTSLTDSLRFRELENGFFFGSKVEIKHTVKGV